jgi:uncharacterized protein (DUF1697 family)
VERYAVLLRGINLGARNRVPMAALRDALAADGFSGPDGGAVKTYLQSGNLAVQSALDADAVTAAVASLVAEQFGVEAPTVARTRQDLHALVNGNPFTDAAAENPKTFQVSFLSEPIADRGRELVDARTAMGETVAVAASGREVYAWHPGGIHTSKLAAQLSEKKLGVRIATARNWTTVLACVDLLGG